MQNFSTILGFILWIGISSWTNTNPSPSYQISSSNLYAIDSTVGNCNYGCAIFTLELPQKTNHKELKVIENIIASAAQYQHQLDDYFDDYRSLLSSFSSYSDQWKYNITFDTYQYKNWTVVEKDTFIKRGTNRESHEQTYYNSYQGKFVSSATLFICEQSVKQAIRKKQGVCHDEISLKNYQITKDGIVFHQEKTRSNPSYFLSWVDVKPHLNQAFND